MNPQGAKVHIIYRHTDAIARAEQILAGNLELALEPAAPIENNLTMEVLEQWAATP